MKRLRIAKCSVTLVNGAMNGAVEQPWLNPDTADSPNTETISLEYVPTFFWWTKTARAGASGDIIMSVTKTGATLNSSGADNGTFKCFAICQQNDLTVTG